MPHKTLKYLVAAVSGVLLAYTHLAMLGWVKSVGLVPSSVVTVSILLAEALEYLVSTLVVCIGLGLVIGLLVKRWIDLTPAVAASSFLVTSAILIQPIVYWGIPDTVFGWQFLCLKVAHLVVSTALLTITWVLLANHKHNRYKNTSAKSLFTI